jgi:hypothetical protein
MVLSGSEYTPVYFQEADRKLHGKKAPYGDQDTHIGQTIAPIFNARFAINNYTGIL